MRGLASGDRLTYLWLTQCDKVGGHAPTSKGGYGGSTSRIVAIFCVWLWWVVGISPDPRQIPTGVAFETDLVLLLIFDALVAYVMELPFVHGALTVVASTGGGICGHWPEFSPRLASFPIFPFTCVAFVHCYH